MSNVAHGYVRASDGTFTTFDAPGAGTGAGQGTFAGDINPSGTIAGFYIDASGVNHGFVGTPSAFITFEAPGAGTGPGQGTLVATVSGINPLGAITGNYFDASNVFHGYVRAPGGTFTTFEAPGAGTGAGQGTFAASINVGGDRRRVCRREQCVARIPAH